MADLKNKNESELKKKIFERARTHLCDKLAKMVTNETINDKIKAAKSQIESIKNHSKIKRYSRNVNVITY